MSLGRVFLVGVVLFTLSWGWLFLLPSMPKNPAQPKQMFHVGKRDTGYYYDVEDRRVLDDRESFATNLFPISEETPYNEEQDDSYTGALDLRNGRCENTDQGVTCYDEANRECPDYVNPLWLNAAPKQYACSLESHYCTIACMDGEVYWYAHSCADVSDCPPYDKTPWQLFYEFDPEADKMARMGLLQPVRRPQPYDYEMEAPPPISEQPIPQNQKKFTQEEKDLTNAIKATYTEKEKNFLKKNGFNLRGAECELLNGGEVCFVAHRGGRDMCPPHVDSLYLSLATSNKVCDRSDAYCTVTCQEGVDKMAWNFRTKDWCAIQEDPGACKPEPPRIPYDEFYLQKLRDPPKVINRCDLLSEDEIAHQRSNLPPISVGVLTRGTELQVLQNSMDTWLRGGFIELIDDFIIMVNEISLEMRDYLEPYKQEPYNIRVLENPTNQGITKALSFLMGNATSEYFLFMEKDFRQVESYSCLVNQLHVGVKLLDSDAAHVVKYRSRYNAGKPNYAEIIYKGREDAVFRIQPNLLCNFYHWIDEPAQRWPNHFDICHTHPLFYCVDSMFCNWTNNPFLIHIQWWFDNFVDPFDEINFAEPSFNLEGFMNSVGDAWNDRHYIVAEGEGLFKHCDINNMG